LAEPLLLVVTGMPASGKTTLARGLAAELQLPLVTKDDIKERLYDELGTGEVEWSRRLGAAAYGLILDFCRELLAAGRSVAAEGNFFSGSQEAQFEALPAHRLVQVCCAAPLEVLLARYGERARHPGHLDIERVGELRKRLDADMHGPLALEGELIEVDTSAPVDVKALAKRVQAAASASSTSLP
jgi:predicted kinase